jgi:hypothetical protein
VAVADSRPTSRAIVKILVQIYFAGLTALSNASQFHLAVIFAGVRSRVTLSHARC